MVAVLLRLSLREFPSFNIKENLTILTFEQHYCGRTRERL
jgi:hypothetical protein